MLWLSYIFELLRLVYLNGQSQIPVCVWAVCKNVNFFPEQGHWAFLGKPSATKLCFGRGSMTWSVMCTCENHLHDDENVLWFLFGFRVVKLLFPHLFLESHEEILLLSCIMPLNVQSKCVSCGGVSDKVPQGRGYDPVQVLAQATTWQLNWRSLLSNGPAVLPAFSHSIHVMSWFCN